MLLKTQLIVKSERVKGWKSKKLSAYAQPRGETLPWNQIWGFEIICIFHNFDHLWNHLWKSIEQVEITNKPCGLDGIVSDGFRVERGIKHLNFASILMKLRDWASLTIWKAVKTKIKTKNEGYRYQPQENKFRNALILWFSALQGAGHGGSRGQAGSREQDEQRPGRALFLSQGSQWVQCWLLWHPCS